MIKVINKINWIIALLLALVIIPTMLSAQIIFIPSQEIIKPARTISIFFFIHIVGFSIYLRLKNNDKNLLRRSKLFSLNLGGKPVFTKGAPEYFVKEYKSYKVTFFIIPFFGALSALILFLGLVAIAPSIYTNYNGYLVTENTMVLKKEQEGDLFIRYSLELEGIRKEINVPRSDFLKLQNKQKIKLEGKRTKLGLLIERFVLIGVPHEK